MEKQTPIDKPSSGRLSLRIPEPLFQALFREAESVRVQPLDAYLRWKLIANLPSPVLGEPQERGQPVVVRSVRMPVQDISALDCAARKERMTRHAFCVRVLAGPAPVVVWSVDHQHQ